VITSAIDVAIDHAEKLSRRAAAFMAREVDIQLRLCLYRMTGHPRWVADPDKFTGQISCIREPGGSDLYCLNGEPLLRALPARMAFMKGEWIAAQALEFPQRLA
jgi:hypothetical protein